MIKAMKFAVTVLLLAAGFGPAVEAQELGDAGSEARALVQDARSLGLFVFTVGAKAKGRVSRFYVEKSVAAGLLPAGLELADDPSHPPGLHPMTFMMVEQTDFDVYLLPNRPYRFGSYREFGFAVNDVRKAGGHQRYWYFHKAFANSRVAVWGGRYFGYQKTFARFDWDDTNDHALTRSGEPIFSVAWRAHPISDKAAFEARLDSIIEGLNQPVIAKKGKRFICSQFKWDFMKATVIPMESIWTLAPALEPRMVGTLRVPSLDHDAAGGFTMEANWRLRGPLKCE